MRARARSPRGAHEPRGVATRCPVLLLIFALAMGCPSGDEPLPDPTPAAAVLTSEALPACAPLEDAGFAEPSPGLGLDFVSETPPGEEVGGVVVADFDGDGLSEVVLGQRAGTISVYWNEGGSFSRVDFGLGEGAEFFGASAADADGDGRLDLFVTGPGTAALYRNDGDRGFSEAAAGLDIGAGWGAGGAWADHDGDGDLDLYLLRQADLEEEHDDDDFADDDDDFADDDDSAGDGDGPFFEGAGNGLWRNDGGVFTRLDAEPSLTPGLTHHARWHDFDGDRDPDLLVLNDGGNFGNNSELWENRDGAWTERGQAGFGVLENPMGALVQDLDGDGLDDLWVSDIGRTRLFQGAADWGFVDVGLTWIDPAEHGAADVSWSLIPVDVDADGVSEIFVTYGGLFEPQTNGLPAVQDQPDRLYRWTGARFESDAGLLPALPARNSRGAARGDLNGDGWPDLVVRNIDGPPTVLMGRCSSEGRVVVRLDDGATANRFGIGARVQVDAQSRAVQAGGLGTYSGSGPELYFGLGGASTVDVSVEWPDGSTDSFEDVCAGCALRISR